jgi:GNAT superfamily N-acetyltransferase
MSDSAFSFGALTPDRWPDLEDLFGPDKGANGGCWCVWPRMRSADFRAMPREARKEAFRAVVMDGPPPGLLAYEGTRAVGWCAVAPREAQMRFEITRTSQRPEGEDAAPGEIFAITCFYVRNGHRRAGMTRRLAAAAVEHARSLGARAVDACPVDPDRPLTWGDGFVGVTPVFEQLGFREIARRSPRRPLMRLDLGLPA